MIKRILVIGALTMGILSVPAMTQSLKIGTNPEYPPFEYKDENNKLVGFDIDIMNELCTIMGRECEYVEQAFDGLIPQLRQRRFDIIISSMDITEARSKQVLFSDPYYLNYSIFVTTKANEGKIDDVTKYKIGVLSGSTHQQYMNNQYQGASISSYPEYPSAISDLLIDRIDIVFGDGEAVYSYVKDNDKLIVFGDKVTDEKYFGKGLAIAARTNDKAVIGEINKALATLKESNKYDEIFKKWFGQ